MEATVERCAEIIDAGVPTQHVAINVAKVVALEDDPRLRDVVERSLRRRAWSDSATQATLARGLEGVARREETPYSVAQAIVTQLLGEGTGA